MFELFVTGDSLPEAYHAALLDLHENNSHTPGTDYGTTQ